MKLNLTGKEILDKQFEIAPRGYNGLEVDEFLDRVIEDYSSLENSVILDENEYQNLLNKIKQLEKENNDLKIDIKKYEERLEGIIDNPNATIENASLLKRISVLEKFLYRIGYNPNTIK